MFNFLILSSFKFNIPLYNPLIKSIFLFKYFDGNSLFNEFKKILINNSDVFKFISILKSLI